jgi:nucleotide-binding universal stress UspA family protein
VEEVSRLVIGVDFSEGSALAVEEARRIAAQSGASIDAVHVVEGFAVGTWRGEVAATAWLTAAGLESAKLVVRTGYPWIELVRHAQEVKPSMVIVGSHGAAGYQSLALGSTAARLGVLSPFPVLVVPPRASRGVHAQGRDYAPVSFVR